MIPVMSDKPDAEMIFSIALARATEAERVAYLDGACGGDAELRARIDELLRAHDEAGSFLVSPTVDSPAEGPGARIGPYKILQQIGEGGFGAVYMAEQETPVRRKVAIKIIKLGMDTKQVVARFEAERQALALMEHPNIAKVFDAGATESGRPYFVMELVKGIPITEYCDQNNLNTEQRLRIFLDVCSAIHHAHQKGVIHRDVKPTNVMVTLHDGRPVPKVIDFGVSKATNQRLTEKTLFTEYHQFIGTPQYMSPEQAEMSGLDIDTRSDLYSLGALLYELLTGTPPYEVETLREAGYAEIQRIIREIEPPMPSTRLVTLMDQSTDVAKHRGTEPHSLPKLIRGDLDWIVMKAMEKDRTRRYETAVELAADVRRHLNHEPVVASPPSVTYKLRKLVQRHRFGVFAWSSIATTLVLGFVLSTYGFVQARHAQTAADKQAARSQAIADFLQDMLVSTDPSHAISLDVDVENVVKTAREVFGSDHATVAATLSSLAVQLQNVGNYDDAEPLQRESVRMWQEHFGEEHVNVCVGLGRLGTLLMIKGDDQAAERAYRESLRIVKSQGTQENIATADTLLGLAEVLQKRGEYGEAVTAFRESLRIRRATAPHQRLQIAITTNAIANALVLSGNDQATIPAVQENLAAFREALPPRGDVLAKVLVQTAAFLIQQDELDEAEPLVRESLEIYRDSSVPSVAYRDIAISCLVGIQNRRDDKSQEFVAKRMATVGYLRGVVPPGSAPLARILCEHAEYLEDRDRPGESLEMVLEGLAILNELEGQEQQTEIAWAIVRRTSSHLTTRPGLPDKQYQIAVQGAQDYLSTQPDEFAVVSTLGALLFRLERYEEALVTLTRSNQHHSQENEASLPADLAFIAMAHHQLGHLEEADAALTRLRASMQSQEELDNNESRALLAEAEALIEPPLPDRPSLNIDTQ
jgi:serine/threonine protein kinase